MAITVMCPNLACRAMLRVPDKVRGKKVRCGQCATVFFVPAKSAANPSDQSSAAGKTSAE